MVPFCLPKNTQFRLVFARSSTLVAAGIGPVWIRPITWRAVAAVVTSGIGPVWIGPIAGFGAPFITGWVAPVGFAPIAGAFVGLLIFAVAPFRTGLALTVTPLAVGTLQPLAFKNGGALPAALRTACQTCG